MRINLFGGPGAGKSTTAAWLFAELKNRQASVEHVAEYVKAWAYEKKIVHLYDQVYLFGKQMHNEYRFLTAGVKNIVTDSPVFLSTIYASDPVVREAVRSITHSYDLDYPCVDIFLERGSKPYVQEGRYQAFDAAQTLDIAILESLRMKSCREGRGGQVNTFDFTDRKGILEFVLSKIDR